MTTADESYRFSGLFEAELLLELMLLRWNHPLAADQEFRNELLEAAVELLVRATRGEQVFLEVPADDMNFVTAMWAAEAMSIESSAADADQSEQASRYNWLNAVRRALPSCFCNPDDLTP